MPNPLERILFAFKLDRKTEILIEDSFLSIIGTTRPAMGYHISLLGPALVTDHDAFEALVRRAFFIKDHLPIKTRLCQIGAFQNDTISTPYLGLSDPAPFVALHNALLAFFDKVIESENEQFRAWTIENYVPHVTLGLGLSAAEIKEFSQRTENLKLEIPFEASSLSLLRQSHGSVWENALELPLKNETGES